MKLYFLATLTAVLCACSTAIDPSAPLPRADAAKMGIDTTGFSQVYADVTSKKGHELHSLMVLKDGKVIYEKWYDGHSSDELHVMNSVSKTFTATAFAFAQQEGLVNINDKVIKYFKEDELPAEPSEELQNLTIKQLMMMSSGFAKDLGSVRVDGKEPESIAKAILAFPYDYKPGEKWRYTNANTYLISAIVTRVTGEKVEDYLKPRLFDPLGIVNYEWSESQEGYNYGAYGLFISTESMARMGQFFLQKGVWNGKRLLPEEWFDEAMSAQILESAGTNPTPEDLERFKTDDWQQGYGYQMWMCINNSCRMDGANCQEVFVIPDKNAVVIMTAHSNNYGHNFNSMWRNVYSKL